MADQVTFVIAGVAISAICLLLFGLIACYCKWLIRRTSVEGRMKQARKQSTKIKRKSKREDEVVDESEDDDDEKQLDIEMVSAAMAKGASTKRKQDDESDDDIIPPPNRLDDEVRKFDQDAFTLAEQGLLLPRSGLPKYKTQSSARSYQPPVRRVYPIDYDRMPREVSPARLAPNEEAIAVNDESTKEAPEWNPFRPLSKVSKLQSRWAVMDDTL